MRLIWSGPALRDLDRLFTFLAPKSIKAAARVIDNLTRAAERLLDHPRLGPRLSLYGERDVRYLIVGNYELRYEIEHDIVRIVRVWHGREQR
jgi:plasmid stabilization system protein ParE